MSDPSGDRQMAGFKDFYQFAAPTRVLAGRDLLASTGFELAKEGAARVLLVTDAGVRATGLVERVIAGLEDGGVELAAVFDAVPPDSDVGGRQLRSRSSLASAAPTRSWRSAAGR